MTSSSVGGTAPNSAQPGVNEQTMRERLESPLIHEAAGQPRRVRGPLRELACTVDVARLKHQTAGWHVSNLPEKSYTIVECKASSFAR